MGIGISQFGIFLSLREKISDKKILSIGIQFPPQHKDLVAFRKNFPDLLSSFELNLLSQTTLKNFQNVLFKNILGAKDINSIDISADEGANYIWNMKTFRLMDDKKHVHQLCIFMCMFYDKTSNRIERYQEYLHVKNT